MTVVRGLGAIMETNLPWQEKRPTTKQLDWVREHMGEDELDKVIFRNFSRGRVADLITREIETNKALREMAHDFHSWGDDW